jgi:hypothetical protein
MHELGHTLGLRHGGADHINYKPNFYSVMNYLWQTPMSWTAPGSWRLDYSRAQLPTLNENNLNENVGLGAPAGVWPAVNVAFTDSTGFPNYALLAPGAPVDWTGDRPNGPYLANRQADLNLIGENPGVTNAGQTLVGRDDWGTLVVNFRTSANYFPPGLAPALKQAAQMDFSQGELTREIQLRLDSAPPPKPKGVFVMDGQRDASAALVGSSGAMNLYAALKPGSLGTQLYLAVDGAIASRDLVVLVAKTPGALGPAPLGKAGQVAGWTALLDRRGTATASEWQDGTGTPFESIVTDSAGAFLEGVVHLDLLLGEQVSSCAIALAAYGSSPGGALLAQVPAGDGDGDLEANEWFTVSANVGVPPPPSPSMGIGLRLSAARPNPAFQGASSVRLSLPAAADVEATVHDVAGRTVATLVSGRLPAGDHEIQWNTRGSNGRRAAPGVYLIQVRALGTQRTARVVVLE